MAHAPHGAWAITAPVGNSNGNTVFFENLADIDGDGDLDAFVGEYNGNTVFFENTGSPSAPAFAPPSSNPFGLADVGPFASPDLADIDGDGDLDAFVGEVYGNTVFFENTAAPTSGTCKEVVQSASSEIDVVIADPTTPARAARQLERANAQIARADKKCDKDQPKRALQDVRRSIDDLQNSIRDGASPSQVQRIIDQLRALVLSEAQAAIQDAIGRMGKPSRIQAAQDRVALGNAESKASRAAKRYIQAFIRARAA